MESCGYGYTTNLKTGCHTKIEQLGNVILEDDVEVGANTTIDRARFKVTLIKKGQKSITLFRLLIMLRLVRIISSFLKRELLVPRNLEIMFS